MKVAAMGIVVKDHQVLLVHRKWYPKLWGPPGGFVDPGETKEEAVCREIWEETGILCQIEQQIHEFMYEDSHITVYACQYISGQLQCSFESHEVGWFSMNQLPSPISPDITIFEKAMQLIENK
ncbi:NUDIX hydrolase [Anaerosolibacter sp.]|uniref:NUDIX hydrolase n=1 Tax=Anaerosolibacter sp. TaxID=1872527 RepID=UPI002632ACDF|nr:NUDIX hydrolase [Anaerosolibacter sp.]MDF2546218.1 hydrolase [Anaerosolibacter sp.]